MKRLFKDVMGLVAVVLLPIDGGKQCAESQRWGVIFGDARKGDSL